MSEIKKCLGALWMASALTAQADERYFTYVYESDVLPQGKWEFEQWLTYRKGFPGCDRDYNRHIWDFREEIEYGLTERLTTALYLNFRSTQNVARNPSVQDSSDFDFKGISAEFKYQLLNPHKQPVGLALYFEPTYNGNEQELEYKVLISKNLGDKWVLAANAVYEQEWEREGGSTEEEAVIEFTTGVAYRLTPKWSVGLEGRYHSVYEGIGLDEHLGTGWFLGPNVHYGTSKWWATLTVLPQITGSPREGGINRTEHQTFETRLIFGLNF
jgi:uncharacterized protein YndB with AHSA1/START domain